MKRYIGIAALSLALAFGFSLVNVNSASAIGAPDPVQLLEKQARDVETSSLFELKGEQAEGQYRVFEPVETEFNAEEMIEDASPGA